jgi:hypothetical protein
MLAMNCSNSRSFQELTVTLIFQSTTSSLSAKTSSLAASILTIDNAQASIEVAVVVDKESTTLAQ